MTGSKHIESRLGHYFKMSKYMLTASTQMHIFIHFEISVLSGLIYTLKNIFI